VQISKTGAYGPSFWLSMAFMFIHFAWLEQRTFIWCIGCGGLSGKGENGKTRSCLRS
jgi:hypothetical protein